jgi:hypothetical protein
MSRPRKDGPAAEVDLVPKQCRDSFPFAAFVKLGILAYTDIASASIPRMDCFPGRELLKGCNRPFCISEP